jgi:hypothetical protein
MVSNLVSASLYDRYTVKLTQLRNDESGQLEDEMNDAEVNEAEVNEDEVNEDVSYVNYVKAIQIRYKKVRDPCVSCQGFLDL